MYIEYLRFQIKPGFQERFIQLDEELWTRSLSQNPGFHKKEVWLNPEDPTDLVIVIWWSDREQWKAIPNAELQAIDQRITEAIGPGNAQLIEAKEYRLEEPGEESTGAGGK
jgi:uncharacterized protein (TIGR03792 family)